MKMKRYIRRRYTFILKSCAFFAICFTLFVLFTNSNKEGENGNPIANMLYTSSENSLIHSNTYYEKKIHDLEVNIVPGLGDDGEACQLDSEEESRGEEDMKRIALNEYLSDKISLNRTLKDYRDPACKAVHYDEDLPSASVVVVFHNEPFSVVLRTVWSILHTGGKYVHEVVLVDDASFADDLNSKLQYYIKTRFYGMPVKMVTLPSRSGLIRARLAGARESQGDVLVFLDAHCECVIDWLRPLLQRIKEDRTAVVVPIIDVIESNNFFYSTTGTGFQVGGFSFSGHFTWVSVSDREKKRRGSDIAPTRSPTMAGGLFAIDRKFFWEIGSYDEMMDGWGGENLEMSFRIWQCGGVLETIPCSRVGHIFRDFHPYKFPNNKDTHGLNTARLALVWMDEYAKYFFTERQDMIGKITDSDIIHRKILREKLNCKSFRWYLDNIYPEKFVPSRDVLAHGRIKNPIHDFCIDLMGRTDQQFAPLGVYKCHDRLYGSQHLYLSHKGELRTEEKCAQIKYSRDHETSQTVIMGNCHGKGKDQKWKLLDSNQIVHVDSGLCLDTEGQNVGDDLMTAKCDGNSKTQKWLFEFNPRNELGNLDNDFDDINPDTFGLESDENGISLKDLENMKKLKGKHAKKKYPSSKLSDHVDTLAKPKSFPGKYSIPSKN